MKVENETLLVIDRKFIEESVETWNESTGNGYLKLKSGHLPEDKYEEVQYALLDNLWEYLYDTFNAIEDPRTETAISPEE